MRLINTEIVLLVKSIDNLSKGPLQAVMIFGILSK